MAGELREVVVNEVDNKEATPAASLVGAGGENGG